MCIKPTLNMLKTAPCKLCFSLLRPPVYNTWTYVTQFGQNRLFLSWGAPSGLTAVSVCCTWRVVICQGDHCFCWVCNIYIHPVTVCVLFAYINHKKKRLLWEGIIKSACSLFLSFDAMDWERGNAYCGSSNKYALLSSLLYYMISHNHALSLVLTTDMSEDRCMHDVAVKNILLFYHIKQK